MSQFSIPPKKVTYTGNHPSLREQSLRYKYDSFKSARASYSDLNKSSVNDNPEWKYYNAVNTDVLPILSGSIFVPLCVTTPGYGQTQRIGSTIQIISVHIIGIWSVSIGAVTNTFEFCRAMLVRDSAPSGSAVLTDAALFASGEPNSFTNWNNRFRLEILQSHTFSKGQNNTGYAASPVHGQIDLFHSFNPPLRTRYEDTTNDVITNELYAVFCSTAVSGSDSIYIDYGIMMRFYDF